MGVTGLFPFIQHYFASQVRHYTIGAPSKKQSAVDYLFLDANGLLHSAAQRVFGYGSNKEQNLLGDFDALTYDQRVVAVYEEFMNRLQLIVGTAVPNKVLYIAIDGPAPLAKQSQQRQRRFLSSSPSTSLDGDEQHFNPTSISPGTKFMHGLVQFMNYIIRRNISIGKISNADWSTFDVIFSPPTVAGEGEHKCLGYLRSLPESEKRDASFCFFGPDADLIMLTMAADVPRMRLLREDIWEPGYVHLLNISGISKELAVKMKRPIKDAIADFMVIGFLVGNDFLPKIREFLFLKHGLSYMLDMYAGISAVAPLTIGGKISLPGLKAFISNIKKDAIPFLEDQAKEDRMILNASKDGIEIQGKRDVKLVNHTLLKFVNDAGKIDYPAYRAAYYTKFLTPPDQNSIDKLCRDYIHMTMWVFNYYMYAVPSWTDYYPSGYAPLMGDLSSFINALTPEDFDAMNVFELGGPSLPFVQLLSILPPSAADLLPKCLRKLLSSEGPLKDVLPEKVDVDYEGVAVEHHGVVDLPFVSQSRVNTLYKEYSKYCERYERNVRGKDSVFYYDGHRRGRYVSSMGVVPMLRSRRCDIATTPVSRGPKLQRSTREDTRIDASIVDFLIPRDNALRLEAIVPFSNSIKDQLEGVPKRVLIVGDEVGFVTIAARLAFPDAELFETPTREDDDAPKSSLGGMCILRHNLRGAAGRKVFFVDSALARDTKFGIAIVAKGENVPKKIEYAVKMTYEVTKDGVKVDAT